MQFNGDVNVTTPAASGAFTPLHLSTYECNDELSKFLVDSGADVNLGAGDGKTAVDIMVIKELTADL